MTFIVAELFRRSSKPLTKYCEMSLKAKVVPAWPRVLLKAERKVVAL